MTGDAVTQLRKLEKDSVDMVMTSPPYDDLREYNGYKFDLPYFRKMARALYRVIKPGGTLVWIVADATKRGSETFTAMKQALYFRESVGFLAHDTMIWHRCNHPLTKRRYEQHWEYMFVFTKGVPKTFNGIRVPKLYPERRPRKKQFGRNADNSIDYGTNNLALTDKLDGNVWKINCQHGTRDPFASKHPAPFPEELAERHIHSWSNAGDVVLDPMCGSGTTGKMALKMGRKFIGIETSAEYMGLCEQRLALAITQPAPVAGPTQPSAVI